MAMVVAVAARILHHCGTATTMRIQRLVYYSQAEALSRYDMPLFMEDFLAWRSGPVCRELYERHRGMFLLHDGDLPASPLTDMETTVVDRICDGLKDMSANDLARRVRSETPWIQVRGDVPSNRNSGRIIGKDAIRDYYREHPILGG